MVGYVQWQEGKEKGSMSIGTRPQNVVFDADTALAFTASAAVPRASDESCPEAGGADPSDAQTLGQRLIKARTRLRKTQAEVASRVLIQFVFGTNLKCALSCCAYAMYEMDKVEPSLDTLKAIAAVLSVSPAWLAFGMGAGREGALADSTDTTFRELGATLAENLEEYENRNGAVSGMTQ